MDKNIVTRKDFTEMNPPEGANSAPQGVDVALTSFNTDAGVVSVEKNVSTAQNANLAAGNQIGIDYSIKSFLAREQIISSGLFSTTDTVNHEVFSIESPHAILATPIYRDKVSGVMGFKGDLNLRLVVNATRFQQGRYILAFIYSGGLFRTDLRNDFYKTHSYSRTQVTQLPHVEIDVSCDTEVTLKIPYSSSQEVSLLRNNSSTLFPVGQVILRAYSPLNAVTGSLDCGYKLYASFSNVELFFPVVPQSGLARGTGKTRKRNMLPTEAEAEFDGPVSSVLVKLSKASTILGEIPLLNTFSQPVSWVSDVLARAAWTLGFSKPHSTIPQHQVVRYQPNRFGNADTKDNAPLLSIFDNNVTETDGSTFGTSIDEMHFDFIKSISAFYEQFVWTKQDAAGTALLGTLMSPREFYTSGSSFGSTAYSPTPIAWLSSMFSLYRGSIKLTFKFVKTEFHSGRLLFSFVPTSAYIGIPAVPSIADSTYLFREIVDVRYKSEVSFVIPWTSNTPYKPTRTDPFGTSEYGRVYVQVLNPLEAPDTVSSSIVVLCEVSAADDFELAFPSDISTPAMATMSAVVPQSGCEISSSNMGSTTVSRSLKPSSLCIGETVNSLRSLVKRVTYQSPAKVASVFASTYLPWALPVATNNGTAWTRPSYNLCLMDYITLPYALSKGGIRTKVITDENNVFGVQFLRASASDTAVDLWYVGTPYTLPTDTTVGGALTYVDTSLNKIIEVDVPFYSRTRSTAIGATWTAAGRISYFNEAIPAAVLEFIPLSTNDAKAWQVFKGASDDFSCGNFVSVPPFLDWSTVN